MQISLEGKKVVITGATGIVGRRITMAFAAEGASLFLAAKEADSEIAQQAFEAGARDAQYLSVDLSDTDSLMELVGAIARVWPAPDVVVNNAGLYPMDPLLSMSVDKWDYLMAVNLRAPYLLTREFAKSMINHGVHGSVINITSGAAFRAKVGHGHYSTSKAGLEMLTKSFALELAPFQIRVNAVIPGFAPGSEGSPLPDDYIQKMAESIPLGRVSGESDAPDAILYLASQQASFITGTTVCVDGGRSAGTLSANDRRHLAGDL